ncbi:MAG: signal peptidase II [Candidatus Gracilibacteria bacterium]
MASLKLDKIWTFFAPLFVVFLGADQLSKEWAVKNLQPGEATDVGFSLTQNDGMVFGFDLPLVVIYLLSAGILGLGTYLVIKYKLWQDHWHLAGLALLLAGALGNLIDRFRFGYVIDFIKVYWWPTFNLADVWIVCAVVLFAWEFLFREEAVKKL